MFNDDLKNKFSGLLDSQAQWGQERRCEMITKFFLDEMTKQVCDLDHDKFMNTLIKLLKYEIRNKLFHPLSVLRIMDEQGGVISYEALNLLQKVGNKGMENSKTIIPSPGVLKKYTKIVETVADKFCPLVRDPHGECGETITFDQTKLLALLIDHFGMPDAAKIKNIEFIQAMDRANLSRHESHTLMGYCIVDEEAQDPITNKILFDDNVSGKLQSCQYFFIVKMVFCRETKK